MKLLDPQKVIDTEKKGKDEQLERVAKLNIAENEAVARMNMAVEQDKAKRSEILSEERALKARFDDLRANLTKEVQTLENKKAKALEPITELEKEAERRMSLALAEQERLASMRESLAGEEERLSMIAENLADKAGMIEDKWEEVNKRENGIVEVEQRLKDSTDRLSQDWKNHHKIVHEVNSDLQKRELAVKTGKETIKVMLDEIAKEKERLAQERRGIKDGYETLARSIERFNKK